jgi:hypothetical protein
VKSEGLREVTRSMLNYGDGVRWDDSRASASNRSIDRWIVFG